MTAFFSGVLAAGIVVAAQAQTSTSAPRPAGQTPTAAGQQAPAQPRPAAPGATAAPRPATPGQGTPPAAGQPPATAAPPVVRRAPAQPASARGGLTITVTDPTGATLPRIHVAVSGSTDRAADTNDSGQLNLPGLLAGSYRLRFSGDNVITYEREVTLRGGQIMDLDVALFAAPKPAAPPPPPPVAPAPVVVAAPKPPTGPTGQPQSVSIIDLIEKDYVGRQPRRESLLSCSGNTRTTMLQINEPLPTRVYEEADVAYYVLGGEGTMKMNNRDSRIVTSAFLSVPRGTAHSFERRGNRPLILLVVLGGEPCETAK